VQRRRNPTATGARECGSIKSNPKEQAMSREIRPNTSQNCSETRGVEIVIHELEPNQRLGLPPCEHTVLVTEGLLYVVLQDDELALIHGEEAVIGSGQLEFAWNAGNDVARIAAMRR
jgi:hypothetical protein